MKTETLELTCIKNDVNGNGRYVLHFLNLNTDEELARKGDDWLRIDQKYALALQRAKTIGGRKFHNKQYGGGIVFQSCAVDDLAEHVSRVTGRKYVAKVV